MKKREFIFITFILASLQAFSQDVGFVDFDSNNWSYSGDQYNISKEDGVSTLEFTGRNTKAYLKDANFTNGTISFEVKFSQVRTFLGCTFRMNDLANYEDFYMRPHQSGNPDATQYTPVYNSQSAWQLYHGENYAQAINYKFDEWIPVKILVNNESAEIYFYNESQPTFYIPYLQRDIQSGMIGLWGGKGKFRKFSFTKSPNVDFKSKKKERENPDAGTILDWYTYPDLFSENITKDFLEANKGKNWNKLATDGYGRLNLSKRFKPSKEQNTALVKFIIDSDKETLKRMDFGFSDRVTVFVNNRPIYTGSDTFKSRDYRFLGSIGFFDSIFLPLKKGKNEITFAVSESFGGWGLLSKIENQESIRIAK